MCVLYTCCDFNITSKDCNYRVTHILWLVSLKHSISTKIRCTENWGLRYRASHSMWLLRGKVGLECTFSLLRSMADCNYRVTHILWLVRLERNISANIRCTENWGCWASHSMWLLRGKVGLECTFSLLRSMADCNYRVTHILWLVRLERNISANIRCTENWGCWASHSMWLLRGKVGLECTFSLLRSMADCNYRVTHILWLVRLERNISANIRCTENWGCWASHSMWLLRGKVGLECTFSLLRSMAVATILLHTSCG